MNTTTNEPEIYTGTPQSATPTSITLAKNASDHDGAYTEHVLRIIEGTGRGEQQPIKSYDGKTKIATLHGTWTAIPDTTSIYTIIGPEPTGLIELINLIVDQDLKTQFESLKEIHELTFSDALEIGMKETIHRVQSPEEIQRRIDEIEAILFNLLKELDRAMEANGTSVKSESDFRWDRDGRI